MFYYRPGRHAKNRSSLKSTALTDCAALRQQRLQEGKKSDPTPSHPTNPVPQGFQERMLYECLEVNHLGWKPQTWSFWDRTSNTVGDAIWGSVVRVKPSSRSRVIFPPGFSFLHWEPPACLCSSLCSSLRAAQAFWAPVVFPSSWPNWSSPAFMSSFTCLSQLFFSSPRSSLQDTPLTHTPPNLLLFEGPSPSSMEKNTVLWAAQQLAWILDPVLNWFCHLFTFAALHNYAPTPYNPFYK